MSTPGIYLPVSSVYPSALNSEFIHVLVMNVPSSPTPCLLFWKFWDIERFAFLYKLPRCVQVVVTRTCDYAVVQSRGSTTTDGRGLTIKVIPGRRIVLNHMVKPAEVPKTRQMKGGQDSEGHSDAHEQRAGKGEVETVPLNLQDNNPFCQCLQFCRVGTLSDLLSVR